MMMTMTMTMTMTMMMMMMILPLSVAPAVFGLCRSLSQSWTNFDSPRRDSWILMIGVSWRSFNILMGWGWDGDGMEKLGNASNGALQFVKFVMLVNVCKCNMEEFLKNFKNCITIILYTRPILHRNCCGPAAAGAI